MKTDFKEWIEDCDFESYEEKYCLYKSVKEIDDWGAFSTQKRPIDSADQYIVKYDSNDDELLILSENARLYFLKYLEETYAGDMDMETWYGYNNAINKAD